MGMERGTLAIFMVSSNMSVIVAQASLEDMEILDVTPIRSYNGAFTQGNLLGEEHSEWVQQHMVEFSKLTGVSIEGFEVEAMNLFVAIEKRWRNIGGADTISKDPHKKPRKGLRELRKLSATINYDSSVKQGSRRISGVNTISMHMRIISWNVRGLNCREKRSQIKNALKMWNGEIICFQEIRWNK